MNRKTYANGDPVTFRDKVLEPCFMPTWWYYTSAILCGLLMAGLFALLVVGILAKVGKL